MEVGRQEEPTDAPDDLLLEEAQAGSLLGEGNVPGSDPLPGEGSEPMPGGGEARPETEPLFAEETEPETDGVFDEEWPEDGETVMEEEFMLENTLPSASGDGMMRISMEPYSSSFFGNQLSGSAKGLYDKLEEYFVKNKKTGPLKLTLESWDGLSAYTFEVHNTSKENQEYRNTPEYKRFHEKMSFDLHSAYKAFSCDHPEMFWTTFVRGLREYRTSQVGSSVTGIVTAWTITPMSAFPDAETLTDKYNRAVDAAVARIKKDAANYKGGTEDVKKIMAIHDYLRERLHWDPEGYERYEAEVNAYLVEDDEGKNTSIPAFLARRARFWMMPAPVRSMWGTRRRLKCCAISWESPVC